MRRGVLVLAAVSSLLLGGCTDDPEPRIGTAPSSSAATAAPSEAETTAAAESPEEFIRRWQQASTDMQNSGDPSGFSELNEPSCESCSNLEELVSKYYAAGGSVRAEPWTITKVELQSGSTYRVDAETKPSAIKESATASPSSTSGGAVSFLMTLSGSPGSWKMSTYSQLAT